MFLTDTEYSVLLSLFHELNGAFQALPMVYKDAFFARLHGG